MPGYNIFTLKKNNNKKKRQADKLVQNGILRGKFHNEPEGLVFQK